MGWFFGPARKVRGSCHLLGSGWLSSSSTVTPYININSSEILVTREFKGSNVIKIICRHF